MRIPLPFYLLILPCFICLIGLAMHFHETMEEAKAAPVIAMTPELQEAAIEEADGNLKEHIIPHQDTLQLVRQDLDDAVYISNGRRYRSIAGTVFVSKNTPYQVRCGLDNGVDVVFGGTEEEIILVIYAKPGEQFSTEVARELKTAACNYTEQLLTTMMRKGIYATR